MTIQEKYQNWLEQANDEIKEELRGYSEQEIETSFYKDLDFGTGGLRGVIGAGTNKLNIHTVGKVTQGLANYLNSIYKNPSVVIGFDSRIKSDVFARKAAEVFAANGIKIYLYPRLLPVPTVSFAVRYLGASCGVMITASHNPSKYNGYKVYGNDGCQITTEAAKAIKEEINKVDEFADIKEYKGESIESVGEEVLDYFISEVKNQSVLFGDEVDKNVSIVYSPLNGAGLEPVARVLKESGYDNVVVVEEQKNPDGNFSTCPYPNPEIKEALSLGLEYCKNVGADLLLATDPDCDRVGIAVKDESGEYVLLSGNEVGLLLLDYICSQRMKHNKMPNNPVMVKTIVTMDLAERIATHYGVRTINVLTGFKFIGEQIGLLEKEGKEDSYILGFEESYGYLSGSYVRDKDGVNGVYLIVEMFAYYKARGLSLITKLDELFSTYGYCLNTLHSFTFEGASGFTKMQDIMKVFHKGLDEIAGYKVVQTLDYTRGINGLPKSDVLKFMLEKDCSVVVRPSGTEPKLKTYISVSAKTKDDAEVIEKKITEELNEFFK